MLFFSLILFFILELLGKMPMKIQFIKEVHNKIWTCKRKKNIERLETKQQDISKQKH
jgi:hypothetical protein